MSTFDDPEGKKNVNFQSPPANEMPTPTAPPTVNHQSMGTGGAVTGILRRWKREDLLRRGSLALRGIALFFSVISFIVMATNKHGDWREFDRYEEYRYVIAIALLSTLYTAVQTFLQVKELSTGKSLIEQRMAALIDFIGDQIMAYLLISAASSAVPLTNRMREGADNIFTDTSSAAISMAVFAFLFLALSALISGYKLSTQPYI